MFALQAALTWRRAATPRTPGVLCSGEGFRESLAKRRTGEMTLRVPRAMSGTSSSDLQPLGRMRLVRRVVQSLVVLAAFALAVVASADASLHATPSFPAPDCPATIHGGTGKLTPSLLSDATHTVKRYEAGGDTNGGEIGCNYYDSAANYNYGWTLYYLFKTDAAAQVKKEIDGGYGPLGGWAHPDRSYCGVSTKTYAYVSCNTTDAETVADAKAMLAAAENLAAPQHGTASAPPKPTATSIRDTPQARAFLGLDDESRTLPRFVYDTVTACTGLVVRAVGFRGLTAGAVPGETATGQHSNSLLSSGSDFHDLMDAIIPVSKLKHNVFVDAVAEDVPLLRQRILAVKQKGSLQPSDVLRMALEVTHGNYTLAVLTAHNLLKDVAYSGREIIAKGNHPATFARSGRELLSQLQPQAQIAVRLADLRQDPARAADKLGPWYHAFAILSVGAIWNPYIGGLGAATREHILKKLGFFGPSEAAFDIEKAGTDFCFAFAAAGEAPALDLATLRDDGLTGSLLAHVTRDLALLSKNAAALVAFLQK